MKLKRLSVLAMLSFGLMGSAFAGVGAFEKVTTATEEGVAEILKGMEFEPEIADGEVRFDHSGMTISIFVSPSDPEEGEMDSLYMVTMLPFDTEKADEVNLLNAENRFIRLYPDVEEGETPLVAAEWDVMVNPGISKWALEYTIREYLEMAELANRSYREEWIDVGPRTGKRDGAFCMGVHPGESRILMNFKPAFGSVATLAHELGHAYHNWCLRERTPLNIDTPMPLAERQVFSARRLSSGRR